MSLVKMQALNAGTSGLIGLLKEKPSKISNITFEMLPFLSEKILELNGHSE